MRRKGNAFLPLYCVGAKIEELNESVCLTALSLQAFSSSDFASILP